jgi:hypothetical protein
MRYHFIPLAVAFGLAACGQDLTSPDIVPSVDAVPKPHPSQSVPVGCLKRGKTASVQLSAKSGFAATAAIPACPEL